MSDSGPAPGGADRPRFVPFSLRGGQFGSAERSRGRERDACLEVDCLRHRLPLEVIERAEERARALGIGADEVLIAAGEISEEVYCRSLAFALRLRFAELAALPRSACPLDDEALMPAARSDILALAGDNGEVIMAVVPRGLAARALVRFVSARPELRERIRLTTRANIQSFVRTHCNDLIGHHAAEQLRARNPKLSAAPRRRSRGAALLVAAGIIGSMAAAPYTTAVVLQVALTAVFLAAALLRLYGALRHPGDPSSAAGREDMPLPRYTVIAALYDEVEALPGLIAALAALDYPPEKLEIKLVLEADDAWTQLAAEALRGKGRFEVVLAPPGGPRTKPKALNYVLPFAAGDLVVVYDAEDRPEPDQLRRAAQAFAAGDGRLACVQARLTIDNTNDSWLTRLFTAEYAGLFDVLLPGLASLHLPIPLGGSSNHFRGIR